MPEMPRPAAAAATGDKAGGSASSGMSNVYLSVIKFENDLNFTSEYLELDLTLSSLGQATFLTPNP